MLIILFVPSNYKYIVNVFYEFAEYFSYIIVLTIRSWTLKTRALCSKYTYLLKIK